MIEYITGNLFDNKKDSLAHCVSSDFKMGAGIAKEFDRQWGKDIRKTVIRWGRAGSGDCIPVKISGRYIFNLVTKEHYYDKPTLSSMECSIKVLFEQARVCKIKTIAMPRIGSGLDKLSWGNAERMIEKHQGDIKVKVYSLKRGEKR